ncbi:helix-turn-helix domain-containing protein [Kitasatospora sp. HPMI-4]|uniref:helix-turn-helix domain-containing protein n=1 Tax=Kitasatospora sp. HPMI-4 TaxID=3448443 RepID=UPI003F1D0650
MEAEHQAEAALAELKERLRRLRIERRYSMAGLEQRSGLKHTTASQALNGPSVPSEAAVIALARGLGVEAGPLLALRRQAAAHKAVHGLRIQAELQFGAGADERGGEPLGTPVHVRRGRDVQLESVALQIVVVNESRQPVQVTAVVFEDLVKDVLNIHHIMPEPLPAVVEPRSSLELILEKEPIDAVDAITFIGVVDGLGNRHALPAEAVRTLAAKCWDLPTRVALYRRRDDPTQKVKAYFVHSPQAFRQRRVPAGADQPQVLATRSMFGIPTPGFLRLESLSPSVVQGANDTPRADL